MKIRLLLLVYIFIISQMYANAQYNKLDLQGVENIISKISNSEYMYILNALFSLIVVIILIYITAFLYRKLSNINLNRMTNLDESVFEKNKLEILSTLPLGQGKTLYVIKIENRTLLIGVTSQSIVLLKELGSIHNDVESDNRGNVEMNDVKRKLKREDNEINDIIKICDKYL